MNILLTGSEGFIGSYLYKELSKNHNVAKFDLCDLYSNDITRQIRLRNRVDFNENEIHLIINLAAISRINTSNINPYKTYDINCSGLVNLLELAKKNSSKVIHFSTSCCSGNVFNNHYSFSKYISEEICTFYKLNGVNIIVLRPHNVYGKGHKNTLMANIENCIKTKQNLNITNLNSIRDYVHVDDVVNITKTIAENFYKYYNDRPISIGTGYGTSVKEILDLYKFQDFKITGSTYNEEDVSISDFRLINLGIDMPKNKINEYVQNFITENQ